jgi:hypothetical protein
MMKLIVNKFGKKIDPLHALETEGQQKLVLYGRSHKITAGIVKFQVLTSVTPTLTVFQNATFSILYYRHSKGMQCFQLLPKYNGLSSSEMPEFFFRITMTSCSTRGKYSVTTGGLEAPCVFATDCKLIKIRNS